MHACELDHDSVAPSRISRLGHAEAVDRSDDRDRPAEMSGGQVWPFAARPSARPRGRLEVERGRGRGTGTRHGEQQRPDERATITPSGGVFRGRSQCRKGSGAYVPGVGLGASGSSAPRGSADSDFGGVTPRSRAGNPHVKSGASARSRPPRRGDDLSVDPAGVTTSSPTRVLRSRCCASWRFFCATITK